MDTDITVLCDVGLLWDVFENFSNNQSLGLIENQSNWYVKKLSHGQHPWPALGRGFNSGVMLMDLHKLNERNFTSLWEIITVKVLKHIHETSLADQDILNAVIRENPDMVIRLDCTWNIQLSEHTISDSCYTNTNIINVSAPVCIAT